MIVPDLAEKDIARCIDLDNVLDLYLWNDAIQSPFLTTFISLFFAVNFRQIRQLPEYLEKLSLQQRASLDQKYKLTLAGGFEELSEGGEGFISEDENDEDDEDEEDHGMDSGNENDNNIERIYDITVYDDDEDGVGRVPGTVQLTVNANARRIPNSNNNNTEIGEEGRGGGGGGGGQQVDEERNAVEFGEEPDQEFQLGLVNAQVNVIVNNQAEADQAAVIAQLFNDFGGVWPGSVGFFDDVDVNGILGYRDKRRRK